MNWKALALRTFFYAAAAAAFPASLIARAPAAEPRRDARSLLADGVREFEKGSLGKAEAFLREALARDPRLESARLHLAATCHWMGKDEAALSEIERIRKDPEAVTSAAVLKGEILLKLSRWQEAADAWNIVPARKPDLLALRYQGLAKAYEGMGRAADAADAWTGYLELQSRPGSQTLRQVAVNRVKAGEKVRALEQCGSVASLREQPSLQSMCKAEVFRAAFERDRQVTDRARALENIQEAVRRDARNLEAAELFERWKAEP